MFDRIMKLYFKSDNIHLVYTYTNIQIQSSLSKSTNLPLNFVSEYLEAKKTGHLWGEFLKAYPDFDGEYDANTENIKQLKTLTIWKIKRGAFQSDEFSGVRTMLNTWSSMIVARETAKGNVTFYDCLNMKLYNFFLSKNLTVTNVTSVIY